MIPSLRLGGSPSPPQPARLIAVIVNRFCTTAGFTVSASGVPMAPPEPEPGASIHDPPVVRRPGDLADLRTVLRNWWSFPAVGFNAVLEMPVYKFEVTCPVNGEPTSSDDPPEEIGSIIVPNSIFAEPIRKDILYFTYWWHRGCMA
ncbi:hypothetical protein FOZ62_013610, partial [Perkinsus olseni]